MRNVIKILKFYSCFCFLTFQSCSFPTTPLGGHVALTASPSGCQGWTPGHLAARSSTPAVWGCCCTTPPPPAGLRVPPRGYSSHLGHKHNVSEHPAQRVYYLNSACDKASEQTSTVGVGQDSSSRVVMKLIGQIKHAGQRSCGSTTQFFKCLQQWFSDIWSRYPESQPLV